jgi:hypothetical protein
MPTRPTEPIDARERVTQALQEREDATQALANMTDRNGYHEADRQRGWRRLVGARLAYLEAVREAATDPPALDFSDLAWWVREVSDSLGLRPPRLPGETAPQGAPFSPGAEQPSGEVSRERCPEESDLAEWRRWADSVTGATHGTDEMRRQWLAGMISRDRAPRFDNRDWPRVGQGVVRVPQGADVVIPRPSTTCDPSRRAHVFVDGADLCRCGALGQAAAVVDVASQDAPLARIGRVHGAKVIEALAAYTVALWLAPRTECSHADARTIAVGVTWCPHCGSYRARRSSGRPSPSRRRSRAGDGPARRPRSRPTGPAGPRAR